MSGKCKSGMFGKVCTIDHMSHKYPIFVHYYPDTAWSIFQFDAKTFIDMYNGVFVYKDMTQQSTSPIENVRKYVEQTSYTNIQIELDAMKKIISAHVPSQYTMLASIDDIEKTYYLLYITKSGDRNDPVKYLLYKKMQGTLDDILSSQIRNKSAILENAFNQLKESLKSFNELGLYHNDIKMDNILFDDDNNFVFGDYGTLTDVLLPCNGGTQYSSPLCYVIDPQFTFPGEDPRSVFIRRMQSLKNKKNESVLDENVVQTLWVYFIHIDRTDKSKINKYNDKFALYITFYHIYKLLQDDQRAGTMIDLIMPIKALEYLLKLNILTKDDYTTVTKYLINHR